MRRADIIKKRMKMLENYELNEDGLIRQIERRPYTYDREYIERRYDRYGELNNYISHLRLGYITGLVPGKIGSIMDVGYGNGSFLRVCEKMIPVRYGYDVNGYPTPEGVVFRQDWERVSCDVVTFFDVIEHLDDPYIIRDLDCRHVFVSVPWCHYISDGWFSSWKHRRPNEHLWFFNAENIHSFAKSCGYRVVHHCNVEDTIRWTGEPHENILTFCLERC